MKQSYFFLLAALSAAMARPVAAQTLFAEGLNHPESIALDGQHLYIAEVGKELKPMDKDGDGVIALYRLDGKVENRTFIKGIDAPKGLAIQGDKLVACDVDQLRVFDKKTGKAINSISFASYQTKFLNDFVFTGPNVGYITATDINKVFRVDIVSGQITELAVSEALRGPNGLAYNAKSNSLIMVEYGGANGEPGRVMEIGLAKGGVTQVLPGVEGGLDGVAITNDGQYLVSDWGKMPEGRVVLLNPMAGSGPAKEVNVKKIGGPADFNQPVGVRIVYLPAMVEGKVYRLNF